MYIMKPSAPGNHAASNRFPESSRSPWAFAREAKAVRIDPPTKPLDVDIAVPGSKSFTNRALIVAAMAQGESKIHGILRSDDAYWLVEALKSLGIDISIEGDTAIVAGCGGAWPNKNADLFIGAAGTTARFLPGVLAASNKGEWLIDGIEQLRRRPLKPLLQALETLGAQLEIASDRTSGPVIGGASSDRGLPLIVRGSGLRSGTVRIAGDQSSQFLSGILLASPYADGPVDIELTSDLVQPAYVGITIELMRAFGAQVEHTADYRKIRVHPDPYQGREYTLEADASTACYFLTLPALVQGRVRVVNVGTESLQPDASFVDILEELGVEVSRGPDFLETRYTGKLRGPQGPIDMKPLSDQALTIAAIAPFADGPITVHGVEHIRSHESDRIRAACENLTRMGIETEEFADGFRIVPGVPQKATLETYDDHRIAMSFTLTGCKVPGLRLLDPACVSKTCPTFFDMMAKVGIPITFE